MTRVSADQAAFILIRGVNAFLWIALGADLWVHSSTPLPPTTRRLLVVVLVLGMVVLLIGAFVPRYIPVDVSRWLYTAFTGFAAMVALAVRSTWRTS